MEFSVKTGHPEKQRTGCIVVCVFEKRRLSAQAEKLDAASNQAIRQILAKGDCDGKVGQTLLLPQLPGISSERILLLGCGVEAELKESQYKEILTQLGLVLNQICAQEVMFYFADLHMKTQTHALMIHQCIQSLSQAFYQFNDFKTQKDLPIKHLRRFVFMVNSKRDMSHAERAVREGAAIAQGIETTKNLANLPPNVCTPAYIADFAKKFAKKHSKISVAILEEKELAALKMGLILSVTAGSNLPAKFITMEYRGARKDKKPIVIVGKGITFDTGGNTIKVPPNMIGMKFDMCGAATVFGVLQAASELDLPLNIIGVMPCCENMPGPSATRPEDIVKSMSGLTVEILNTDAEGRLILADALTYCERFHPEVVISVATLTGGCFLALGQHAQALMSNNQTLSDDLYQAGLASQDKAWPLPIWDEYHQALKSEFADISNVPISDVGARTIIAACFLAKFTQKYSWAHLDVANTATQYGSKRGASGRPVSLLMQYLLQRCE